MPIRHLPNDPDLDHLRGQAKSLLAAYRSGDPDARSDFEEFHPRGVEPAEAKLADAQLALARAYQQSSWPRLRVKVDAAARHLARRRAAGPRHRRGAPRPAGRERAQRGLGPAHVAGRQPRPG